MRTRAGFTRLGAALTALLLGVSDLSAQPMTSIFVRPGERVRVTTREVSGRRVGVLQQVLGDSVIVDWPSGERETLPLGRLSRIEVSDGIGSFVAQGMGYGFLAGAVAGAAYGIAGDKGGEYFPPVAVATVMSIAGGLVGTVAGGMVGAAGRRERWTKVRLEQPLRRVTVTPYLPPPGRGPSRAGVQVGVRF